MPSRADSSSAVVSRNTPYPMSAAPPPLLVLSPAVVLLLLVVVVVVSAAGGEGAESACRQTDAGSMSLMMSAECDHCGNQDEGSAQYHDHAYDIPTMTTMTCLPRRKTGLRSHGFPSSLLPTGERTTTASNKPRASLFSAHQTVDNDELTTQTLPSTTGLLLCRSPGRPRRDNSRRRPPRVTC